MEAHTFYLFCLVFTNIYFCFLFLHTFWFHNSSTNSLCVYLFFSLLLLLLQIPNRYANNVAKREQRAMSTTCRLNKPTRYTSMRQRGNFFSFLLFFRSANIHSNREYAECTKCRVQKHNTPTPISHSNAPSSPVCGRESYMYTIHTQKHTHTFMTVSVCLFIVAYSRRIIVSLVMNFVCTIAQKFESLLTKYEKFNDRNIEKNTLNLILN